MTRLRPLSRPPAHLHSPRCHGCRYVYCNGTDPTADQPCELGATAYDTDGEPGAQNLTSAILACPPTDCLSAKGCSSTVRTHKEPGTCRARLGLHG